MKNTSETRFEMQGAQFPDQPPFLQVMAMYADNHQYKLQINFNKLNQEQKATVSLAVIKQLADLSLESLQKIEPKPYTPLASVADSLKLLVELANSAFEVLQPPDAGPKGIDLNG